MQRTSPRARPARARSLSLNKLWDFGAQGGFGRLPTTRDSRFTGAASTLTESTVGPDDDEPASPRGFTDDEYDDANLR